MTYSSPVVSAEAPLNSTSGADEDPYDTLVTEKIAFLAARHARGEEITPEMMTTGVEPEHFANTRLRSFCTKHLGIKAADYDRAMRHHAIKEALGYYPKHAMHFVEEETKRSRVTVRYNGAMEQVGQPVLYGSDGLPPLTMTEANLATLDLHHRRIIEANRRDRPALHHLQQDLRVKANTLGLQMSGEAINDAVERWYRTQRKIRLEDVRARVTDGANNSERKQDEEALLTTCRAAFAETEDPAYAAAVLRKFIWQVKRKLFGIPVTGHLMPVILGPQRRGKSTFMRLMLGPVDDLSAPTNFGEITDHRNIDLWSHFVLVLDEMSGATKADIETTKNVITAEGLSRRPMRTNTTVTIPQMATLIGASNAASVGELIRDTTGLGRFAALTFSGNPDYEAINAHDWPLTWQCVDMDGPDPMIPFRDMLAASQEEHRDKSPVEAWLADFKPERRTYKATDLFLLYSAWEADFAKGRPLSKEAWGKAMKSIERDGKPAFRWRKAMDGNYYDFTAEPEPPRQPVRNVVDLQARVAATRCNGD